MARTRKALGFDQPIDFARELSVDKGDYSKYESGKKTVPLSFALKLKTRWNIPLDWTICGDPAQLSPEFYHKIGRIRDAA